MGSYRDLADELHQRILKAEYPSGSVLPPERELAEKYGVSRTVVRSALAALERRRAVAPRHGNGWVVQSAATIQGFDRLLSFGQWARSRGLAPGGQIVESEIGHPSSAEAGVLHAATADKVLRFARLRSLDGRVVMVERSVWAPWVVPIVEKFPPDIVSVTDALADAGVMVEIGSHRIDAVNASSDDVRLLGVRRSSAMLRVRREMTTRDGRPVEYGEDRYIPGSITFEVRATSPENFVSGAPIPRHAGGGA